MNALNWILVVVVAVLFFLAKRVKMRPEDVSGGTGRYELPPASAGLGLLDASQQNTVYASRPRPEEAEALAAAREGRWEPAAALLRTIGEDWDRRSAAAYTLGGRAAEDDTWLLAWEQALPDDPDAAVVRARSTVILAWNIRGGQRAHHTTSEQFQGFHEVLARSCADIERAAALNPADPTPYITGIWTALGLGMPHDEMQRLWKEITARAPHHYEAHFSALQYWCAKWRGSQELAERFALQAAASAPPGSLLSAMPLICHFEHDESKISADRSARMVALVDAAVVDVTAADPAHPRTAEVHHLVAYYLSVQKRHAAAVEHFRLVDGYVGALPWRYDPSPAAAYCRRRDASVRGAARRS
ncbi:hypothetical protein [Streptomyces sp. NBC_01022]|uniref:hypothetical protein n=1 Tax=Streptomyces sp. NBC_01022 TaxID=2903723 RepID=UPI002DDBBFAA|nr:hypothetical protein [Streptomyces sp. NBC_01022]WRZ84026.1 hypothetical protein OG316_29110 [Streptomyces sp. NBC_01022]